MLCSIDISVDSVRGLDKFFKKNGKVSEAVREMVSLGQRAKQICVVTQIVLMILVPRVK